MKNITLPYYQNYFKLIQPYLVGDLKQYKVTLYGAFNNCSWNGGRINANFDITYDEILKLNKLGVSFMLTFTNYIIDLNDNVGLELLNMLDKSQKETGTKNCIVLFNEEFRLFLRDNYDFNLKFSIIGHKNLKRTDVIDKQNEILKYYKDLETKYDIIVGQSELMLFPWFYENIDKTKYEVIMNIVAVCNYCEIYEDHYKIIADTYRTMCKHPIAYNTKHLAQLNQCLMSNSYCKSKGGLSGLCFDPLTDSIQLYDLYNHFKFEGRSDSTDYFLKASYGYIYLPLFKYVFGKDQNSAEYINTIKDLSEKLKGKGK